MYTIPTSFIVTLMAFISVSSVMAGSCPDSVELMRQTEQCLIPLSQQPNNTSVPDESHLLTWTNSCSLYNTSLKCVRGVMAQCDSSQSDTKLAQSIVNSLQHGMYSLCENQDTYQRYTIHSTCYTKQEAETDQCLEQFNSDFQAAMQADKDHLEYSTWKLCRSFDGLIDCVHKIIHKNCGEEAADLFDDLVSAQVPSQVTSLCASQEKPDNHLLNQGSLQHQSSNASTLLPVNVLFGFICFMTTHSFMYLHYLL